MEKPLQKRLFLVYVPHVTTERFRGIFEKLFFVEGYRIPHDADIPKLRRQIRKQFTPVLKEAELATITKQEADRASGEETDEEEEAHDTRLEVQEFAQYVKRTMKRYVIKKLKTKLKTTGRALERASGSCQCLEDFCAKSAPGGYLPIFITHDLPRHIYEDTTLDEAAALAWGLGPVRLGRACVSKDSRPYHDKKHFSPRLL